MELIGERAEGADACWRSAWAMSRSSSTPSSAWPPAAPISTPRRRALP